MKKILVWIFELFLLSMPFVHAALIDKLIYNQTFPTSTIPSPTWNNPASACTYGVSPGYLNTGGLTCNPNQNVQFPNGFNDRRMNYTLFFNMTTAGADDFIYFSDNCRVGIDTAKVLHVVAGGGGSGTSLGTFVISSNTAYAIQADYNRTNVTAYLYNISTGNVIDTLLDKYCVDIDGSNMTLEVRNTNNWVSNFSITVGGVALTGGAAPSDITYYNLSNNGGCDAWNTDKNIPCNTTVVAPTVQFNTSKNAWCAIAGSSSSSSLDKNYTDMGSSRNCTGAASGEGALIHSCTLTPQDELVYDTSYLFISCKDDSNNQNRSSTSGPLRLNVSAGIESNARGMIELAFRESLISSYSSYTDQRIYARNSANSQATGKFDKVVKRLNKIWAINRIGQYDSFVNMFNITPVLYTGEFANLTGLQVQNQVELLINSTK